jgi:hypothetical protein
MTPEEKPQFITIIAALAATFRQDLTEAVLTGFWMGLEDLSLPAVKSAASRAMREKRFLPCVAELRELAGVAALSAADRALRAWTAFEAAVYRIGPYRSVDFDDPLVNATSRSLGGWEACCVKADNTADFETWTRKAFLETYEALYRTGAGPELTAALVGIHERENAARGYLRDERVRASIAVYPVPCGLPALPKSVRVGQESPRQVPALVHELAIDIGRDRAAGGF